MEIKLKNPELEMLENNKESGYNYRERRQDDWEENYTLYRDKVVVNRLTQRQSVNIPLMKQTIRTLLKDVDDMPVLYFENLDNNKQAELFKNEYWKWTVEKNNLEVQDIVDKRQVFMFGRSFTQMQIADGMVKMNIVDPQDILVSRFTNPTDLNSSRFLIHTHIFKPLSDLENETMYDKQAVQNLKTFYGTEMGLIKQADNQGMLAEKNKKLEDMGYDDVDSLILGETYVELSLHFVFREDNQIWLYVEADDQEILMKKPLDEVIGKTEDDYWKTHFPYDTWADDVEKQDFWSDGIADIVRTPNKVLNSWFSQLVENRTLRNYGMKYYDATIQGFVPNTETPRPGGWYGLPGKPSDVFQNVEIPDLSESLDEMMFVIQMAEKATGATATQQGTQTERKVTLGEVELALGEAKERIKGMSKFYTPAWKRRGEMFCKFVEAAPEKLDAVKIYKKGRNSQDLYEREISPKDWMTKKGYGVKVWSQEEKNATDTQKLEKLNAVKMNMPDNPKLNEIYQRKLLTFADLEPDEINEVMDFEQQKLQAMQAMQSQIMIPGQVQPQQPQAQVQAPPVQPVDNTVKRLKTIKKNIKKNA